MPFRQTASYRAGSVGRQAAAAAAVADRVVTQSILPASVRAVWDSRPIHPTTARTPYS